MKLNLLSKLLLPSLGTLLVLMISSAFLISHLVAQKMEDKTMEMMKAGDELLARNVKVSARNYGDMVAAVTIDENIKPLADHLSGITPENGMSMSEARDMAATAVKRFAGLYRSFPVVNIAGPDGIIIASSDPMVRSRNVDVSNDNYFKIAMMGKTNISEPVISSSINDKAVIVAAPMKNSQGRIAGSLFAILPLKNLAEDTVQGVKLGKTGNCYIVHGETGLMLAHEDYSRVQTFNVYREWTWASELRNKNTGTVHYMDGDGDERIVIYQKDDVSGWIAVSQIKVSEFEEVAASIRNITMGIMLGAAFIVAVIMTFLVRQITRDVTTTNIFAQAIAGGDLNRTLDVHRTDELGNLGDALRTMVESLKGMIKESAEQSENAKREAENAHKAMADAKKSADEVLEAQKNMLDTAEKLEKLGTIVSSATTQLAAQIEQSDKGAAESAARLGEAASAMNEMNATVQEVAKNASSAANASADTRQKAMAGAEIVKKSVDKIEQMRQAQLALRDDMIELSKHAQSISQIMGVISDIADQTNLLALNAAIEAARAGEAGRGFAVVADEVRKLAEKTMASTADVGNATKSIQESTSKSMDGMQLALERLEEATQYARDSGNALEEIVSNVEATSDQVSAIATASEEQSAASDEITRTIGEVNDMSAQTAEAMGEAAKAISELVQQTTNLTEILKDMRK